MSQMVSFRIAVSRGGAQFLALHDSYGVTLTGVNRR